MQQNRPQVIMLDWDGTLADSLPAVMQAMRDTFEALGMEVDETVIERSKYEVPGKLIPEVFGDKADEALTIFNKNIRATMPELLPNAEAFIHYLNGLRETDNVYVSVVSARPQKSLDKIIDHFGLRNQLDHVVGSTEEGPNKPNPETLDRILEHYTGDKNTLHTKIGAKAMLMVGDSIHDRDFARALGCRFAAVGNDIDTSTLELGEHVGDVGKLQERLEKLFQRTRPRDGQGNGIT